MLTTACLVSTVLLSCLIFSAILCQFFSLRVFNLPNLFTNCDALKQIIPETELAPVKLLQIETTEIIQTTLGLGLGHEDRLFLICLFLF